MRIRPRRRLCRRTCLSHLLAAISGLTLAAPAAAQVPYAEGPLLDIVRSMPAGSWQRVNSNSFSDVWTPSSLRPLNKSGNPTPSKIIAAWSSFAWDSNRGDLILYGGGHANYSGNDVYRWRSRTLRWERVALPSEIKYLGSNVYTAVDGVNAAPTSAHTYDNAVFLPLFDRYLNFGGAIYNTGGAYVRRSESDSTKFRRTGPYFADLSRAHSAKVGGTTGSHVKRVASYPDIVGARLWQNRDIPKNLSGQSQPRSHVSGCTAYSYESDTKDVVYVAARRSSGGTAMDLFRYEVGDLTRPGTDRITKVGIYWSSPSAQTTCALDPVARAVVKTGSNTSPFFFWNLATAGTNNREQRVSVTGSVASFTSWLESVGRQIRHCAMDHDPNGRRFMIWCGGGTVWSLKAPSPLSTTGWQMTRHRPATSSVPSGLVGTGLLGRWEYIPGFDVFIGLQDSRNGHIWVYKPPR